MNIISKKKFVFGKIISVILCILTVCILTGCSSGYIQIDNNEQQSTSNQTSESGFENILTIGDKFYPYNLYDGSGKMEATIKEAKVIHSLSQADISLNDCFEYTLIDGINYDKKSDSFIDKNALVLVTFSITNLDAISKAHNTDPDLYSEYDFRADALGGCTGGGRVYFSDHDELKSHYYAFNLMPGETKQFVCGYLVDLNVTQLEKINFETAATPENGTIINLGLGDE